MKKSKQVLLSAAIAAAIMGSVSLPQVQAAEIGSGVNLKATESGVPAFGGYDVKTTDPNLKVTLATQEGLRNVNSELKDIKDNMKDSLDKAAQATNKANSAANDAQVAADKANHAADNIKSDLDKKVDKTQYNWDKAQTNAAVQETKDNLNTFKNEQAVNNQAQHKDIEQNKKDIKANAAATNKAQADATKANDKADAALKVTGNGVLYNHATNLTDGVNQNTTAISANKAAITKETNDRVAADNALSDRITNNSNAITTETNDRVAADTVLSNRITDNSSAIQSLRHDVSDLGTEIDNVGAISAALAGLHPLDWNGSGSKFQLSAAAGTYDGKQAMALGGFYHPNRNMMLSLGVSSSFGSDRKTAGNVGITFRVGKGSNGTVSDDVAERLAAMDQKISQLESQNQKLTSMLAIVDPSLTKEFPDVPANHWAYEAVSKLAGNDIIEGYPDGDFHGDRTITRYEMAQVIYKALKKGGTVDQKLVKEFNKEIEAVKANDAQ